MNDNFQLYRREELIPVLEIDCSHYQWETLAGLGQQIYDDLYDFLGPPNFLWIGKDVHCLYQDIEICPCEITIRPNQIGVKGKLNYTYKEHIKVSLNNLPDLTRY